MIFPGFKEITLPGEHSQIFARTSLDGSGEPLVFVHGFPETGAMWHHIAPALSKDHPVVVVDLRGYGRSVCETGADQSFRSMAVDLLELQRELNIDKWHAVGHDRGARAVHRFVKDYPDRTSSAVLMDVVPTRRVWDAMQGDFILDYYHWSFLGSQTELAAKIIERDADLFLESSLDDLSGLGSGRIRSKIPDAVYEEYRHSLRTPWSTRGILGDYRSAALSDVEIDKNDTSTTSVPVNILWGSKGALHKRFNVLREWEREFLCCHGQSIEAGHFLVEENPDGVMEIIKSHLKWVASIGE